MRKISLLLSVFVVLLAVTACETLDSVGSNMMGGIKNTASGGGAVSAAGVDIRSGEMLASWDDADKVFDAQFRVGKVMTVASEATKNQAEVLFADGEKKWAKWVLDTHKAKKEELKVGEMILYHNYSHYESLSQDDYRKGHFQWGTITSIDELFKGVVEVQGRAMQLNWCRMPDAPLM